MQGYWKERAERRKHYDLSEENKNRLTLEQIVKEGFRSLKVSGLTLGMVNWSKLKDSTIESLDLSDLDPISSRDFQAILEIKNLKQVLFNPYFTRWWGIGLGMGVGSGKEYDIEPFLGAKEYEASRTSTEPFRDETPDLYWLEAHQAYRWQLLKQLMNKNKFTTKSETPEFEAMYLHERLPIPHFYFRE
jgi:hypothetical protein